MDNRVFNINGKTQQALQRALNLAFIQAETKAYGFLFNKEKGLVLSRYRNQDKFQNFPCPLDASGVTSTVWTWLQGKQAQEVTLSRWESKGTFDGSRAAGWRVYCEDWGHVDNDYAAFVAIKPCWMWYGK